MQRNTRGFLHPMVPAAIPFAASDSGAGHVLSCVLYVLNCVMLQKLFTYVGLTRPENNQHAGATCDMLYTQHL